MNALTYFISTHKDWQELLARPPYNLQIKCDGDYALLKYNMIESNFDLPEVCEARGCIYKRDGDDWFLINYPFSKFWNYGESRAANIKWENAIVTEKIDGSMVTLWWDEGWHWSTSGTIDAFSAPVNGTNKTFGNLIDEAINYRYESIENFLKIADADGSKGKSTHIFELVSLDSKVVIPYEQTDLFYLGSRFIGSGHYYDAGFKNKPQEFPLKTIDDVIAAAAELDWRHEGFVVFDGVNRIKCKSPAWIVAHHSVANGIISDKTLVYLIMIGEIDELLAYCPEYAARVDDWKKKITMWCIYGNAQKTNMKEFCDASRAEYAEKVHRCASKEYWDFLFKCFGNWDYTIEEYLKLNWKKIWF